jgi:hypothetical protein
MEVKSDQDGEHILSSRDLCTIHKLEELLPYLDALKIEGRSKSEFYVSAITTAYKHVRDAILHKTAINPEIMNLVNIVPHRAYRDGFLFNAIKDFPDGETSECSQTTGSSAGPLFNRNYFGTFTPTTLEAHGQIYHQIDPKEELKRGMKLKYFSPNALGEIEILDIINEKGKSLEKADCNTPGIFVQTSLPLSGWESLYLPPTFSSL